MKKYLLLLIIPVVLFSSCKSKVSTGQVEKKIQKTQKATLWGDAPDFTLPLVGGNTLTLSSHKEKIIILNFWATWCPPCRMEIPDFVELYKKYKSKGLTIIGVNLDRQKSGVKKFMEKMKINYPVVEGNSSVVKDYGGIRNIPTTFIIDKKGNIKKKIIGYRSKDIFEDEIKSLLKN